VYEYVCVTEKERERERWTKNLQVMLQTFLVMKQVKRANLKARLFQNKIKFILVHELQMLSTI
jgi:hypothetical protein